LSRLPVELSPTERRERVGLAVSNGRSNRSIAAELGVDEATVRRDRRFLVTPPEQRPVKKPKKANSVRVMSPEQTNTRRLKELLKLAQDLVAREHLILPDIEYVLHEAGKRLYRDRAVVMRLPDRTESPSDLLAFVQPQRVPEDHMPARLEYCVDWLVRWLAICLPREEGLRDAVLRSISTWARG
jgi:hypothetical protein